MTLSVRESSVTGGTEDWDKVAARYEQRLFVLMRSLNGEFCNLGVCVGLLLLSLGKRTSKKR